MVNIFIRMGKFTKDSGKMINRMDMEFKNF